MVFLENLILFPTVQNCENWLTWLTLKLSPTVLFMDCDVLVKCRLGFKTETVKTKTKIID